MSFIIVFIEEQSNLQIKKIVYNSQKQYPKCIAKTIVHVKLHKKDVTNL